jgi:hypothetical protein
LNSRLHSNNYITQLALIAKRSDITTHGYDLVFRPLIDELKTLETDGIDVYYMGELKKIRGTISYIISDNLAANNLAGLVESFGPRVNGNCDVLWMRNSFVIR